MESASRLLDPIQQPVAERRGRLRQVVTMLAVVSLLGAALVIARDASTSPVRDKAQVVSQATNLNAADAGAPATLTAQIDVGGLIRAIVCPILNALAFGPLGGFIGPIIAGLRASFGCVSG